MIAPSECCGIGDMAYDDEFVIAVGDQPPAAPDAHHRMLSRIGGRSAIFLGTRPVSCSIGIRVALRHKKMIGGILYVGIGLDPGSSDKRQLIAVEGHPVPMNPGRDRAAISWR